MIGRLRGNLLEKKPPVLLIDVAGVGYEVQASMQTIFNLPALGELVSVYTHHISREDGQYLFAFGTEQERELFRYLIKAQGVGPKLALAILSSMSPNHLIDCVRQGLVKQLVRIPGVGKKTAERLILDMKDKIKDFQGGEITEVNNDSQHQQDAISALIALGYKPAEAERAIAAVKKDAADSETLIRLALQGMAA